MHTSSEVAEMINTVFSMAQSAHFEYVTPELALYVLCQNKVFARAFENCGGSVKELDSQLRTYLDTYMERRPAEAESTPELSMGMGNMLAYAWESAEGSGKPVVELPHVIHAMYELEESYAVYYMRMQGVEMTELLQEMAMAYEEIEYESESSEGKESTDTQESFWQQYAVCLNDEVETFNPLIGREEELERTMQILCRKEKNNPLHIGEPELEKLRSHMALQDF